MTEVRPPLALERPGPLELVSGIFLGFDPPTMTLEEQLARIGPAATARSVMEDVVIRGLRKPPCVIGFSGGRDSSAVLAVAVHVARREGLALPVPFTEIYPGSPRSHEDEWQERVVSHLGLNDWERVEFTDEFDAVGDLARAFMRRHGVTLGHLQKSEVMFGRAAGGTYMDGEGGDEVFGFRRAMVVRRTLSRPWILARPRAWKWLAFHLVPQAQRRRNWAGYHGDRLENRKWLRPETYEAVLQVIAEEYAAEPFDARRSQWAHLSKRRVSAFRRNRQTIAHDLYGVTYLQPFLEPEFVAAWARQGGLLGLPDRTAAMRAMFADVLPGPVIERTTKAFFNTVFLGERTRQFAETWSGAGVDEALVDPGALREQWLSEWPSNLTSGLLQCAWLADNPG